MANRKIYPVADGAVHPMQGFKGGDSKNCVVRTYANVFDLNYMTAHDIFAKLGRKNHDGMQFRDFANQYLCSGMTVELFMHSQQSVAIMKSAAQLGAKITQSPMTLSRLLKDSKYQIGTFAVLIKGHIFCLRNGKIYDTINSSMGMNTQVVCVFEKV